MPQSSLVRFAVSSACLFALALAGCGSGSDPTDALAAANSSNLQRLTNLYFAYQTDHNWRGPADEAEFKSFLRSIRPEKLTRIGIEPSQLDAIFISERDGQPFKIRYGLPGDSKGSAAPVIFEAAGDGNVRRVGFLNMQQRDVEAAEYDALWSSGAAANPAGASQTTR